MGVGYDHYPGGGGRIPEDFGVAELGAIDGEDGVAGILGESVTAVGGVGYLLCFFLGGVERVDGHHAVGLVGEESGGVVRVDHCRATEDAFAFGARVNGNGLVGPMIKIS